MPLGRSQSELILSPIVAWHIIGPESRVFHPNHTYIVYFWNYIKVARYSLSGSIPPKFERKLRRHKQRFGKINTTVVLDKDENL